MDKPIIFFDGVCTLCNSSVSILMKYDKDQDFYYASLQGETAKSLVPEEYIQSLNSMVLLMPDGKMYFKADAVAKILEINSKFKILSTLFSIIPRSLSFAAYDQVAKYRYKLFGKEDTCRIPTADEQSYFLK